VDDIKNPGPGALFASDKCDFQVRGPLDQLRPRRGWLFASDKCDFAVRGPDLDVAGRSVPNQVGVGTRTPDVTLRMSSDKCDWRVVADAAQVRRPIGESPKITWPKGLEGQPGRVIASDKCDWRILSAVQRGGVQFDTGIARPTFRGSLQSSKCEWSVRAAGGRFGLTRPPHVDAWLRADKCDFSLHVQVGLSGGPAVQFRVAGSDKCDFRIDDFRRSEDGTAWRPVRVDDTKKG
jgi:hypothetical protein